MLNRIEKENGTYIWAMGGLNEIGKNMYIIENQDDLLIIDAGIKFANQELLGMNGLVPDFEYLKNFKGEINLVITHGHEDHIGGVPYLLTKVGHINKIYVSQLPSELIKRKMGEFRNVKVPEIVLFDKDSKIKTKHFELEFFSVAHSIPNAFGIAINSPDGLIVTAGDYRFDFAMEGIETDIHRIVDISKRGIDVFLGESTNAETVGFSESEKVVIDNVIDIIRDAKGRVFMSTFASNLGRIEKIIDQATKINRKICLIGRAMENNVNTFKTLGLIKATALDFITVKDLPNTPDNEVLIILTGSQGESKAALNRIALGEFNNLSFKPSDTVILSSNPIPGNFSSVENLINFLYRSNVNVFRHGSKHKIHASGHATGFEMQLMFKLIKPKYIVPIHGEFKMLKKQQKNAGELQIDQSKVIIVTNGQKILLKDKKAQATDIFVDVTAKIIDGKSISNNSERILKERYEISTDGIFNVALVIDYQNKKLLARPVISTRGVLIVRDSVPMISKIGFAVQDEISKLLLTEDSITKEMIENKVKETVRYYIWKNKRYNPLVLTTIFDVA